MSLRSKLKAQTDEVVSLQTQLSGLHAEHAKEKDHFVSEIKALQEQVATLSTSLESAKSDGDAAVNTEMETLRKDLAAAQEKASASEAESTAHVETKSQLETARSDLEAARSELELAKLATASAKKKVEELEKGGDDGKGKKGKKGKGGGGGGADVDVDAAVAAAKKEAEAASEERIKTLETQLEEEKEKAAETEDLLVLLEELTQKRKRDKASMREKGMDVSEDEGDEDEE